MIASPMGSSMMPGEPMVIVPTHNMTTATPSNYYFGATLRMGVPMPYYDATTFGHHPSQPMGSQFGTLPIGHHGMIAHTGNEMSVDESVPLSPSSSNSTDQDDEESAAAILHALESGSLSPRGSPLNNPLHASPRSMKHNRRIALSPITGRRKRVASLSEVHDVGANGGKEPAEEFDELSVGEMPTAMGALHVSVSGGGHGATSWSLPTHSPLTLGGGFSPFAPVMGAPRMAGSSAASTTPIPIPRARQAFSPYHASSASLLPISATAPSSSHKKNKRQSRARLDNHQCPNCHTSDSPLWRNCLIKGKILHLCNSCGLRYKKHKYCPHCYKVYYDADTNVHDWAQCVSCHNWTHRQCLNEAGIDYSLPGSYKCLRCLGLLPDCD